MNELELLKESYLMLQKVSKRSWYVALCTDNLRSKLRNKISEIDGIDPKKLQESVEQEAYENPL